MLGGDAVTRPALATTYEGGDFAFLERIVPLVDALEIAPDSIATRRDGRERLRADILDKYAAVLSDVALVAHGVGLSIGSFDQWNEGYLRLLDELFERFSPQWHSEHLGYMIVAGENLGTMLPLPRTEEAVELVCRRITLIQDRYPVPFLLEHVIQLLPEPPGRYSAAGFLNAITSRTGCGLILDAYNLECDERNRGLDIEAFLQELDLDPVREVHLAGGVRHNGIALDVHSRLTSDRTLALGLEIVSRGRNVRMVTYEILKEAVVRLGHDAVCAELQRIRDALDR